MLQLVFWIPKTSVFTQMSCFYKWYRIHNVLCKDGKVMSFMSEVMSFMNS
jgi:hypothetical protein